MNTNPADNYTYRIEWNSQLARFVARCLEFPSLSADGATQTEALNEIVELVKEGIEILSEAGDEIPAPFSERTFRGRIPLRVPPTTHRRLAMEAAEQQVSLNQHLTSLIESAAGYNEVMRKLNDVAEKLTHIDTRLNALETVVSYAESVTAKLSDETQFVYSRKLLANLQSLRGLGSQWDMWFSASANLDQGLSNIPLQERAKVLLDAGAADHTLIEPTDD